jgi:hypothetical protein
MRTLIRQHNRPSLEFMVDKFVDTTLPDFNSADWRMHSTLWIGTGSPIGHATSLELKNEKDYYIP